MRHVLALLAGASAWQLRSDPRSAGSAATPDGAIPMYCEQRLRQGATSARPVRATAAFHRGDDLSGSKDASRTNETAATSRSWLSTTRSNAVSAFSFSPRPV